MPPTYDNWVTHTRLTILERKVVSLKGLLRQLGIEAQGVREMNAVGAQPMGLWDVVGGGTQPPTTSPPTTAPVTSTPVTTVPVTTAPVTTAPLTTAVLPPTTAPPTTSAPPATTGVATTLPVTTAPVTTAPPGTTVPPCSGCASPPNTVTVTVNGATDPDCDGTYVCEWMDVAPICSWSVSVGGVGMTVNWSGTNWLISPTGTCTCAGFSLAAANCHTSASGAGCGGQVTVTP